MNEINNNQKNYFNILEIAKINYYKEEYYMKEDLESSDFKEYKYKDETIFIKLNFDDLYDYYGGMGTRHVRR